MAESSAYLDQKDSKAKQNYSDEILQMYSGIPVLEKNRLDFSDFDTLNWLTPTVWIIGDSPLTEGQSIFKKKNLAGKVLSYYKLNGFTSTLKRASIEIFK